MCTCKPNHAVHAGDGKCYPSKLYRRNFHRAFMKFIYILNILKMKKDFIKLFYSIFYLKSVMIIYQKQNNSKITNLLLILIFLWL